MPTEKEYFEALHKADAVGDTEAAEYFADRIRQIRARKGSAWAPLMQGLTLGFADELAEIGGRLGSRLAGAPAERVRAAGERQKEQARGSLEAYRERDPVGSFALEMAGSLSPGMLGFRAVQGTRAFANSPVLTGIMTGFVEGGVAGTGAAEEGERLPGAVWGGTVGAAEP